jgi:hypothetical protein
LNLWAGQSDFQNLQKRQVRVRGYLLPDQKGQVKFFFLNINWVGQLSVLITGNKK